MIHNQTREVHPTMYDTPTTVPMPASAPQRPSGWQRHKRWALPTITGILGFTLGSLSGAANTPAATTSPAPTVTVTATAPAAPPAAPAPTTPAPETSTESAAPAAPEAKDPTAKDFHLSLVVLSRENFDTAGSVITYRVKVDYTGGPAPDGATYQVRYQVNGGDAPQINNFTATNDTISTDSEEVIETPRNPHLTVKVLGVDRVS